MSRLNALLRGIAVSALLLSAAVSQAKPFIIYDRMDYIGKPDLTPDKLSKVFLIYESELVMPDPTGKRAHGVLNEKRIRELAKQSYREGYRTISTDIESWFSKKDGQIMEGDEMRRQFARMYQIFREENPRTYIGNYGIPGGHLNATRYFRADQSEDAILKKWRESIQRPLPTAAISDYANPVFYIMTPDIAQWEKDMKITMDEIKKRFPNKKIIGYLWPQYYSAKGSPHFKQFIDAKRWRQMLDISYKYLDGVIIWSDKRDEHDKIVPWTDPRIQAMMTATKGFIAAHPKDIVVEGLQKPAAVK
ncbi:hypothetical protein [Neisseria perflava]|uniref:hypothetical protein n=1 Tax=Neisseria perflava TaxID=33053 RepID=UPI00209DFBA5|nr:hypothetical protein [Neisseria perflava]MCP1661142.1 hypothetical protein [Neisseria perflava]MCP1772811.1 hypothetical protein [Neisseria perflava]